MAVSKRLKGSMLLILASVIWGTSFIAQKKGVGILPSYSFNGIRTMLGCIVLLPVIYLKDKSQKSEGKYVQRDRRTLIIAGLVCGILLCIASTAQTEALVYADAGKAGFMTALYIVIVPILGVFAGKRITPLIGLGVVIATVGMYFLCVQRSSLLALNSGDKMLIFCAFVFSLHILAIDYFSPKVDGVKLSCIQFFVSGTLNLLYMFFTDIPSLDEVFACAIPLLYAGVMSSGVAYTLQIVGQKHVEPAVASILMSLESLFALLAGIAFGEQPTARELAGCALMMIAIVLVQLPESSVSASLGRIKRGKDGHRA